MKASKQAGSFRSVAEAVLSHAERQPQKLCLADDREEVSYQQYADKILRLAAVFAAESIGNGDLVVVEASQCIDFLATEFALHVLGAVFVPVEHNCSAEKMISFAHRCTAKGLISIKKFPSDISFTITLSELISRSAAAAPYPIIHFPKSEAMSSLLFSTGTTGVEKGIVLTHENDVALCENVIYGVDMQADNVEFILSPFNHSHGLRRYYANMYLGASVIMQESVFNAKHLFYSMERYGVNSMDMVPAALAVVLQMTGEKLGEYRTQLRYLQFGGAPIPQESKAKLKTLLPHTRLMNGYGSTESGISSFYDFNTPHEKENCIGKPSVNAEIFFVDENKHPMKADKATPGFLACRGRFNMKGYWEDEAETAKVLLDGVIYSNDVAYLDEDGDIIMLGRKGDVINIGGKKVSPTEIEDAARNIAEIVDCACIGVPHKEKGSEPKLFVQMADGYAFNAVDIRRQLSRKLEPYKVPALIVQIDKIPRTYKGSLQRHLLQNL